jgi:hypothetical protein
VGEPLRRRAAAHRGGRRAERPGDRRQRRADAGVRGGRPPGRPAVDVEHFVNSGVLEDPRLALLGDVFASPSWLPLQNVYSPGDLLLLAGAFWVVHRACGTVLARDPRPWLRGARPA